MVILTSIDPILEKCVHLQVQYSRVLSQYVLVSFKAISIQSLELLRISKVDINVIDVTILVNIALAGENIFQVLAQNL